MDRRRVLTSVAQLMFAIVVIAFAYAFVSGLVTTNTDKAGVVELVNIKNIKPGEILKIRMKYPVWILRRTEKMQTNLANPAELADPESRLSVQPLKAKNNLRSIKPEYFVFVPMFDWTDKRSKRHGYINVIEMPEARKRSSAIGFADSAFNLKFDYSGRIYKFDRLNWVEQANNLIVPEHKYVSENKIKVNLTNLTLVSDLF